MKVGILRCQQTEVYCPATTCLVNAAKGARGYAEVGPVEVIGDNSYGGCPGKQVYARPMINEPRLGRRNSALETIAQMPYGFRHEAREEEAFSIKYFLFGLTQEGSSRRNHAVKYWMTAAIAFQVAGRKACSSRGEISSFTLGTIL